MPDSMWLDLKRYESAASSTTVISAVLAILIFITKVDDLNDENYEL